MGRSTFLGFLSEGEPAAPDPCIDDNEAAERNSDRDRSEKEKKNKKNPHQVVLSEVFLFKFERVSSRVSASTKVRRKMFGLFAVFFFLSSSSSSSVHENCRKLTSARVTQKWVRGKIVQY